MVTIKNKPCRDVLTGSNRHNCSFLHVYDSLIAQQVFQGVTGCAIKHRIHVFDHVDLSSDMLEADLLAQYFGSKKSRKHTFTPKQFLSLIRSQWEEIESSLLVNGNANVFCVYENGALYFLCVYRLSYGFGLRCWLPDNKYRWPSHARFFRNKN